MEKQDPTKEIKIGVIACDKCGKEYPSGMFSFFKHNEKCNPPVAYGKMPTEKELNDMLTDWADKDKERRLEREKTIKENIKHLLDKEKELGKDCPVNLLCMVAHSHPLFVSQEFLDKYKEWF